MSRNATWLSIAKTKIASDSLQSAYQLALEQLSVDRSDGQAWGIMSLVALEGNNPQKSLELSSKAMGFGARDIWIIAGRGRALLAVNKQDEARGLVKNCEPTDCETALEADTVGVVLARSGLHAQAVPYFEYAIAKDAQKPQFWYNLATSQQFTGNLKNAAQNFARVLDLDPSHHQSRLAYVQYGKPDHKDLAEIEVLFAKESKNADNALLLGHAAARVLESRAEHEKSLSWLHRAKAQKKKLINHQQVSIDRLYAAAKSRRPVFQTSETNDHDLIPIFIVGMPRSGTTLIERILSSHSSVHSAGELSDVALLVKQSTKTKGRETLSPEVLTSPFSKEAVRAGYFKRIANLANGAPYIIDKMPFNFFFASHIAESFPNAKIIMVRRDPRDTVFANYRQLFATDFGFYNYAYDLADTAHFVANFNALADYWQQMLPAESYSEFRYEDMIADQESESKRLVGFAGLEWEEQCLNFHENNSPVATASSVQVRSPIHSKSVGQWKRYGTDGRFVDQKLREFGCSFAKD